MATEPISKLLGASPELEPLAARLDRIQRLQQRYRTFAPGQLAAASRVCAIDGTIVIVCAASGAVAALLRQLAPRLLEALRGTAQEASKHPEDQELNGIRVEVQVAAPAPARPSHPRTPMPRQKLAGVARGLADSPLKDALERIGAGGAKKPK
jgi:Dna[CI] antecedent DciA-like protein